MKRMFTIGLCAVLIFSFSVAGFARNSKVKNVYVGDSQSAEKILAESEFSLDYIEAAENLVDTEINKEVSNTAPEYVLSLEDAIKMAVTDNPQFENYDTAIKDAEVQLEQAKRNMRDLKGAVVKLPSGIDMVAIQKGYYVNQAQINLEAKKLERKQNVNILAYNVTSQYYGVNLAQSLLECANNAYEIALTNKKNIDTRFSLGQVAELDVKNADLALDIAKINCNTYERQVDIATENLKLLLQIENPDCTLTLTDDIEFEEFNGNLDADTVNAMNNRYDIYQLKKSYDQSVAYRDVTSILGGNSSYYSSANKNVVQCEYLYTNTQKQIRLAIKSYYNDILSASENLALADKQAELAGQEYEVAKLKADLGMITNSELTEKMNAVSNAQMNLEKAKLTYKLAVQKYNYEISIGL